MSIHICHRQGRLAAAVLVSVALPLVHGGAASAQTAQDFEALMLRLETHPSVVALRAQAASSDELARAARGLPDPVLSAGVNNVPVSDPAFDRFLPSNKAVGIEQRIPSAGVRRARSAREKAQAHQYSLRAAYRLSQLKAQLIGALADRVRIGRQMEYAQRQRKLYGEMEEILRGELEAGRPIYFRLSEIDVERADIDRRLTDLENERTQTDALLVQLVGQAAAIPPPDLSLQRWDENPNSLFSVRVADTEIGKAQAGVREGKANYRPDWGIRLQYQQREDGVSEGGMPFAGDDWFSAGVSLTVPLWAAQNQAPRLRAARARESSARASLHAILRMAREQLTALYSVHDSARRNIEILETKRKSLRTLIESARRNYEAGRATYVQVLDGEIGLLTLQSQIEAERARRIRAAAEANSHLVTP